MGQGKRCLSGTVWYGHRGESQRRSNIRLLAEAGLNAFRFTIEWVRIEPEKGRFEEQEIEHYRNVIACCEKYHVTPVVTMHHFSSPKWLISQGGYH